MTAPRHRSLNLAQTLDELLGTGKYVDGERQSLNSASRPPTRHGHGRDSASAGSSNEENKEPSPKTLSSGLQTMRIHDPIQIEHEADDFLSKLNALRRRSLVADENAQERKIPVGEEKKRDLVRQPTGIREESEDEKEPSRISSPSSSSYKAFQNGEMSSATVVLKKEETKQEVPKPKPRSVGKPSTSAGVRPLPADDSNHSKWVRMKADEEKEKQKVETEKEGKKKKKDEEKKKNAQRTFERWKEEFDLKLNDKRKESIRKERAKSQTKDEMDKKKREEAQKTFEVWKRENERRMKEETEARKAREEEGKKKKKEAAESKREEAEKAFIAWKSKKEKEESDRKTIVEAKRKAMVEREKLNAEYKELVAQQAFETWMELKEVQYQQEQLRDVPMVVGPSIPWMPPSNTIPRIFTPDPTRRRKSLDKRVRITSASTVRRSASAKSLRR